MIVKTLKLLWRRENKQNDKLEVFNKELENINKLRAEEYNHWNKKYSRWTQQQIRDRKEEIQWDGRQSSENHWC